MSRDKPQGQWSPEAIADAHSRVGERETEGRSGTRVAPSAHLLRPELEMIRNELRRRKPTAPTKPRVVTTLTAMASSIALLGKVLKDVYHGGNPGIGTLVLGPMDVFFFCLALFGIWLVVENHKLASAKADEVAKEIESDVHYKQALEYVENGLADARETERQVRIATEDGPSHRVELMPPVSDIDGNEEAVDQPESGAKFSSPKKS